MGLDVELFRIVRVGTSPRRRRTEEIVAVGDIHFHFASAIEKAQRQGTTPMLARLDLYGLLELSSDEMPQFLGELSRLLADTEPEAERKVMLAVRGLAERCAGDRDLGLRFVGD
ncbi:hypothetical protein [Asanoa iriomotensis]|uniref:hypothetical protein n=1 Tax=Asanoa iriomotensis TaxID=234613 RepID=UPI001945AC51|nr:hypothetical protein [Asanoa iriomotensis]